MYLWELRYILKVLYCTPIWTKVVNVIVISWLVCRVFVYFSPEHDCCGELKTADTLVRYVFMVKESFTHTWLNLVVTGQRTHHDSM